MDWKAVRIGGVDRDWEIQHQSKLGVLRSEKGYAVLRCAFCRGKGTLTGGGTCSICGGRGEQFVVEPIRKCVFCNGTGRGEARTENSCVVCKGKGAISVVEPTKTCPDCKGKGRRRAQPWWPCVKCAGRGILPD